MNQRVLGIDPGTVRLGFGVLEGRADRPVLVDCGTLQVPARWPAARRLGALGRDLAALLDRHRPDSVALEASFHGRNAQSMLRLGEARGLVLGLAGGRELEVSDYSPSLVKKAVTGRGSARKETVARILRALLPDLEETALLDTSDALAVALCHLHRARLAQLRPDSRSRTARGTP